MTTTVKVVMAIDPGPNTGVAIRMPDGSHVTNTITRDNAELWELIVQVNPAVVVIERFAAQLISRYGLETVDIVGSVKGLCWRLGIPVEVRVPQQRKAWMLQARALLQTQKSLDRQSFTPHQHDALAHLLAWEARHPNE